MADTTPYSPAKASTHHRAVLTGCSEGIGREIAIALARQGVRLGLIARRRELLEEVRAACLKAGSPQVELAPVDVTKSEEFRGALATLDESLGGATIFIANAGIAGRSSLTRDSFADARRCIEVNVLAAIDGIEWMKERMVRRGEGILCGVSSVAATRGLPDSGAYSASKAALSTYLESMRVDFHGSRIRIVTVAPGFIDTALTKKNKGKMPFLMDARRAGEIFAQRILRGQRFVVAPWQYWWVIQLLRLMPGWLYESVLGLAMSGVRGSRPR